MVEAAADMEEWAQALVGRDWEIFWNDQEDEPDDQQNVDKHKQVDDNPPASQVVPPTRETVPNVVHPEALLSSDRHATTRAPELSSPTAVDTSPESVPNVPSESKQQQQQQQQQEEEEENKGESTKNDHEDDDDASMSEATQHADGWYMGRIEAYLGPTADGHTLFRVRYAGDEEACQVALPPGHVRPNSQRWILRSLALLHAKMADWHEPFADTFDNLLPPDTSLPRDTSALQAIRQNFDGLVFPDLQIPPSSLAPRPEETAKTASEAPEEDATPHQQTIEGQLVPLEYFGATRLGKVAQLRRLLAEQIYLRSQLGPVQEDDDDDEYAYDTGDWTPPPPSETYVNHLVSLMKQVQEACIWVEQSYQTLLARVYGGKSGGSRVTKEQLLTQGLGPGQVHLQALSQMDPFSCPNRRKRKQPTFTTSTFAANEKSATSRRVQNRNKRQRIDALFQHNASGQTQPLELEPEDLWVSTKVVTQYIRRMVSDPSKASWCLNMVAQMLQALSLHLIEKFRTWQEDAEVCLGRRDGSILTPDDSGEERKMSDEESDAESAEEKFMVSYRMIACAIDATEQDPVLSHFDFTTFVSVLREKLRAIDEFETRCWRDIGRVLENVGSRDPESDPLLLELQKHLDVANDPQSALGNIHPLGRPSTDLTREVVENSIVYRRWFLDLLYAESRRERSDFVEQVVGRISRLPPFQSPVVRSPNESAMDLSLTLDAMQPRVQVLSKRILDHVATSNRYKTALSDRHGAGESLASFQSKVDLESALLELGKASVLSVAEEMALCRQDVLRWLRSAETVLSSDSPPFKAVKEVYSELEILRRGQSASRQEVVKNLRSNPEIDEEMRSFVLADLALFEDSVNKTCSMYATGDSWITRFDSIVSGLQAHGNEEARIFTECNSKNTSMVDFKRIEDLLTEYKEIKVSFENEHKLLEIVYNNASQWAEDVLKKLMSPKPIPLDDALNIVESANADSVRPKGVIIHPTRHVLNSLSDLLRWHQQLRNWLDGEISSSRPFDLMVDGAEVIEAFSVARKDKGWYQISAEALSSLVMERTPLSKSKRHLSVAKLESNPLTYSYLQRFLSPQEDGPLLHLLYFAWELHAQNLLARMRESPKGTCSLEELRVHLEAIPGLSLSSMEQSDNNSVEPPRTTLRTLVSLLQEKEESIRLAYSKSKALQRDCIRNPDLARSHFADLKETHSFLKSHPLAIEGDLEVRLEREVKLYSWMVKALEYHVLKSEDPPEESVTDGSTGDGRIPWDVLLKLRDTCPTLGSEETGGLACLITRVRELYENASSWQDEISAVTQISLRGGKRRGSPAKGVTEANDSEELDMQKLNELCERPILKKVAMPRETAVRSMMKHTIQFESELYQFLGEDFDGADRAPYPRGSSLVEDGRLIIFRLTGSPLYASLKDEVLHIESIASRVFAETPGMRTFDWVKNTIDWIDALASSFTANSTDKLVLRAEQARQLVEMGENILLDVPDGLKQTLSLHGIFVSTNKDGKLTVKSLKKGAQYAVGTTIIRWCPILYDSLRSDLSAFDVWMEKFQSLVDECSAIDKSQQHETESIVKYHMLFQEFSDLRHQAARLVVAPLDSVLSVATKIFKSVKLLLEKHSSPDLKKKAVDSFYKDGKRVVPVRDALRDALLDRLVGVGGALVSLNNDEKGSLPFRYAARFVLKKALQTTSEQADLRVSTNAIESLCEIKALEIEKEIFERFPAVGVEERINPDYRQQTLTLKRGLSDSENIELCLQILTGKISPVAVAKLTSEELAGQRLKMERALAEKAAKDAAVLTKPIAKPKEGPLKPVLKRRKDSVDHDDHKVKDAKCSPTSAESAISPDKGSNTSILRQGSLRSGTGLPKAPSKGPPPPPPSLSSWDVQSGVGKRGTWARNSSGSEQFHFSLGNNARNFRGGLVEEICDDENEIFLPEELVERGRLPVENFVEFVQAKIESKKWGLCSYRVISDTDLDEKEVTKFCKDYESKRRLSMLSLDGGNKLFIIPPKLGGFLKSVVDFQMPKMVYAVLLFRK